MILSSLCGRSGWSRSLAPASPRSHAAQTRSSCGTSTGCPLFLPPDGLLNVYVTEAPRLRRRSIPPDAAVEGAPGLLLKLPLPSVNLIGMDLVPLCQIRHRSLLSRAPPAQSSPSAPHQSIVSSSSSLAPLSNGAAGLQLNPWSQKNRHTSGAFWIGLAFLSGGFLLRVARGVGLLQADPGPASPGTSFRRRDSSPRRGRRRGRADRTHLRRAYDDDIEQTIRRACSSTLSTRKSRRRGDLSRPRSRRPAARWIDHSTS
jgi:hypothetical protein